MLITFLILLQTGLAGAALASGIPAQNSGGEEKEKVQATSSYVLGPDDVIAIKAVDADEINSPSLRIDPSGTSAFR